MNSINIFICFLGLDRIDIWCHICVKHPNLGIIKHLKQDHTLEFGEGFESEDSDDDFDDDSEKILSQKNKHCFQERITNPQKHCRVKPK